MLGHQLADRVVGAPIGGHCSCAYEQPAVPLARDFVIPRAGNDPYEHCGSVAV